MKNSLNLVSRIVRSSPRIIIFLRATLIVLFTTSDVYAISHELYLLAIILSAGINTIWVLNVKDLSVSNSKDRASYVMGGITGTIISLYILNTIFTN